MQVLVNAVLFQMEFGISAGLASLSCRATQKMNVGISTRLIVNIAMLPPCLMYETSVVIDLCHCQPTQNGVANDPLTPGHMPAWRARCLQFQRPPNQYRASLSAI